MAANKKEICKLIDLGHPTAVSLHPDLKAHVIRSQIDAVVREARRNLTKGKPVHLVLIKE